MDVDEETKLMLAALESFKSGKITPLLKEELKYRIQSRRLGEGKAELTLEEQPTSPASPLRPDEVARQDKRREQNRRAATKFRLKKKHELDKLQEVVRDLLTRNEHLKTEINRLTIERDKLQFAVISTLTEGKISEDHFSMVTDGCQYQVVPVE